MSTQSKMGRLLLVIQGLSVLSFANGAGQVVKDYRIQSKDSSPAIGRGYSVTTGNILNSCLEFDSATALTNPSFDYQYSWDQYDTTNAIPTISDVTGASSKSAKWLQSCIESETKTLNNPAASLQFIVSLMAVDKYYITSDETQTRLTPDAEYLLDVGYHITFFQACGPNYIKSIRKQTEMASMFYYVDHNDSSTNTYKIVRRRGSASLNYEAERSTESMSLNMKIKISAFGIKLLGENALMPRNFVEYKNTLDSAFQMMMDPNVGSVASIEVVSWMTNPSYQNLIRVDNSISVGAGDTISPFLRRLNLSTNAEHVARLDELIRIKTIRLHQLVSCLSALASFSTADNRRLVRNKHSVCTPYEPTCDDLTHNVFTLRSALVGEVDGTYLVQRKANSLNTFVTRYVKPCLEDLSRDRFGVRGGSMQMFHWTELHGCEEASCLFAGTEWDNETSTCKVVSNSDNVDMLLEQYCQPELLDEEDTR